MLVNKTVEFFLSEAAGRGWMPARARSETKLRVYCCEKQDEKPAGRDGMPAGIEAGTGTRCRRGNHRGGRRAWSGQGPDEMPARKITGAGGGLGAARDRTRCRRSRG